MAKLTFINGVWQVLKNGAVGKRLRNGKKGPSAVTTTTVLLEVYATKRGLRDSATSSATFTIQG